MRRAFSITLLAAAAIALRLWHVAHGLPDFVEEAIPFRRALDLWGWETGRTDWNPHHFHYPSLSFYLHFLLQQMHFAMGRLLGHYTNSADYFVAYLLDPTPMVLVARMLGIASDAATVVAVALIGERVRRGAGLVAAALVALAPAMILNARSIYTDGLVAAFSIWALERMLAYRETGRRSSLGGAIVFIGLAAGTKYPAAALLLVLAWAMWERHRGKALGPWLGACGLAFAVFLVTSPFVALDFPAFLRDFTDVSHLAREGHFGHLKGFGFGFYARGLAHEVGWIGAGLAVSSAALAIGRARRGPAAVGAWLYLLALGLPISLGRVEAERYLLPLIPVVASLAALALFEWLDRVPPRGRVVAVTLLLAALALPVAVPGLRAAAGGGDDTQLQARRWIEAHLSSEDILVQEAYGARLPTVRSIQEQARRAVFARARAELQQRYLAQPTFRAVGIPLAVAGRLAVAVPLASGGEAEVEITPQFADLNRVFYDPRLLLGVDYLLTSMAVRGRYLADTVRYAQAVEFYRVLEAVASPVARFSSSAERTGPEIRVYRLDERAWSALRERFGALTPLWWCAFVPGRYRERVDGLAVDRSRWSPAVVVDAAGRESQWRTSLQPVFSTRMRTFAYDLSRHLAEVGRVSEAEPLAAAIVEELPGDFAATALHVQCATQLGHWQVVRASLARLLELRDPTGRGAPLVRLDFARALARTGDLDSARSEIQRVLETPGLDAETTRAAQELRAELWAP